MKKIDESRIPEALRHLPRFVFTDRRPATREEAARTDVEWGVRSIDDLLAAARRRFGDGRDR